MSNRRFLGSFVILLASGAGFAQKLPRTPDGHPDLQGVWTNSTLTPLERPGQFAGKTALTEAEATAYEKDTVTGRDRDKRDADPNVDVGRAYNELFFDQGTKLARIDGTIRTSMIVDPPDGRVPALTPEAEKRQEAARAVARMHPADGPENRSLAEQCVCFGRRRVRRCCRVRTITPIRSTRRPKRDDHDRDDPRRSTIPLNGRPHFPRPCTSGWAIPKGIGKATRWWRTGRTTMPREFSRCPRETARDGAVFAHVAEHDEVRDDHRDPYLDQAVESQIPLRRSADRFTNTPVTKATRGWWVFWRERGRKKLNPRNRASNPCGSLKTGIVRG